MAKIAFYIDTIENRDFAIDAVELISAPFETAEIYCLNFVPGILGPIAKRRVISSAKGLIESDLFKKIPLLTGSLKLPKDFRSVVTLSQGYLPVSDQTHLYYFYSPYWESENYREFYKNQSWFLKKWLDFHQKKVILSLQKNQSRLLIANKKIAKEYQLEKAEILYPFFKSEDFPRVELGIQKQAVTILLQGSSFQDKLDLLKLLKNFEGENNFFIFGSEQDQSAFASIPKVRFESQYCSATLQAAFLQSHFFFQFSHNEELPLALGALASGAYVAHRASALLSEVIPQGLLLSCHGLEDIFSMLAQWNHLSHKLDLGEARRFALRFSERSFKDKILSFLNSRSSK
jgi:hypothetical protein